MKTLLIVDGNNIAHRVRHKFNLSNGDVDVSVTFGFLKLLMSYMRKYTPEAVIVAWDGGIPPFRRKLVPSYKANRTHGADDPLAWEDFIRQMEEVRDVSLPLMGVMSVWFRYVEADDLMYQAAFLAKDEYDTVVLVSNDKDLYQTARIENVFIHDPNKNVLKTHRMIEDEFDVTIENWVHWRALQGDSSDNIPGVKGIGPKTASKLFRDYKYISGIINAATEAKLGKIGQKILEFGLAGVAENVRVMGLAFDRTGSRKILIDESYGWQRPNLKAFRQYLARNLFDSLDDPSLYALIKGLQAPVFQEDGVRTPIIIGRRQPYEIAGD